MEYTGRNIPEVFLQAATKWKKDVIYRIKKDGQYSPFLWKDLSAVVEHFSLGLSSLGIRTGERIAILSESRPEWVSADLAILSLGAITVPIFPTYRQRDIEYIIQHSESCAVIIEGKKQWEKH